MIIKGQGKITHLYLQANGVIVVLNNIKFPNDKKLETECRNISFILADKNIADSLKLGDVLKITIESEVNKNE